MHGSVLQNDDYIEYSSKYTVEVLSMGRLDEAIEKGEKKAATYTGHRNGKEIEFMISWPGLTAEEIEALRASKAGQYNDTGGIPMTYLVNPHTLEKVTEWQGGGVTAKKIMEAADEARDALEEEHGEGFSPKDFNKFLAAEAKAWKRVTKDDFTKALKEVDKQVAKAEDWPEAMQLRVQTLRRLVVEAAERRLEEVEALLTENPRKGKPALRKLISKLKGTGLVERAKELLANA